MLQMPVSDKDKQQAETISKDGRELEPSQACHEAETHI
jgi:hypothetical protein